MTNFSEYRQEGDFLDHTPAAAVDVGTILQVASLSLFAQQPIAAAAKGALARSGVIRGPYVGGIANVGDNVYWDANGTPYGGATTGAFTCNAAAGDWWAGTLFAATVAASAECALALNVANPNLPAFLEKTHIVTGAADLTLVAATHSGGVVHVNGVAAANLTTITLPVGVVGMDYVIQNDCADGLLKISVDLNGTEIVAGANLTIATTKTADLTLATGKRGDFLHLVCNVAATSWRCVGKRGIWVTSA